MQLFEWTWSEGTYTGHYAFVMAENVEEARAKAEASSKVKHMLDAISNTEPIVHEDGVAWEMTDG